MALAICHGKCETDFEIEIVDGDGFTGLFHKSSVHFRIRILCSDNKIMCAIVSSTCFPYASPITMKWHNVIF